MGKSLPWANFLTEWLSDPGNLINYLQVSLEEYLQDGDTQFFLHEIKSVIEALGGIPGIAEQANVAPKILSDAINKGVMPPFRVLDAFFKGLGWDSSMDMDLSSSMGMVSPPRVYAPLPVMEEREITMSSGPPPMLRQRDATDKLTERQWQNKKYWGDIRNYLDWADSNIICPEPSESNFQDLRIKGTGCALRARQTVRQKEISAAFVTTGRKSTGYFYSLRIEQEVIETEFGDNLEWTSDKKSYKQIGYRNREMDPADETDWHNQHTWLSNTLEKLYTILHPRIEILKGEF